MQNPFVCLLDYGSGNVKSVYNMISILTSNVKISNNPSDIKAASHLILPGVGAFATAMEKIHKSIPLKVLQAEVFEKKKPFLGICVGMQVLATVGLEFGKCSGLNWIPGQVDKLRSEDLPLPHIGWNNITFKKPSSVTKRFTPEPDFYFLHSYAYKLETVDPSYVIATAMYGEEFCAVIEKDNIFGVQFHPEKSQKAGKILLENFLSL